jgi:hypothetical protein
MRDKLPLRARLLILVVAAEGVALVALRTIDATRWNSRELLAWVCLTAAITAAEQFTIPIPFLTETLNFSVTEGVWIAALILARASVLTLAVGAGVLLANSLRRFAPYKAAFNVGQFVLSVTVAQIVYGSFHVHGALHPMTWLATGLAMAAYAAVNAGLVALIISLVERKSYRAVLLPPLRANALHFAGNTAIGTVGAILWAASPFAFPVVALLLAGGFITYQMVVRASVRHHDRARGTVTA